MFITEYGFSQLLLSMVAIILTIGIPVGILLALYAIYKRLKSIDKQLKKTNGDK